MNRFRSAVLVTVLIALSVVISGSVAKASETEHTVISAAFLPYVDGWVAAATLDLEGAEAVFPDATPTITTLSGLFAESGPACKRYAGITLGIVTLSGLFGDTRDLAYLQGAGELFELLEVAEYDCLISD
jgi:hypothetical protein